MSSRVYRVVQWTTGNVGQRSVIAAAANPELEIVGCYAWGPDKVGRDVGELCGIDPIGVLATNDIDALLALKPDCVVYNPKWPDVDHMVRILESGINITATAGFITGHALGAPLWGDRQGWRYALPDGRADATVMQAFEQSHGLYFAGDAHTGLGRIQLALTNGAAVATRIATHAGART